LYLLKSITLASSGNIADKLQQLLEKEEWSHEDRNWLLQYLDETGHPELHLLMQERFDKDVASDSQHPEEERLLSIIHKKINGSQNKTGLYSLVKWKRMLVAASIVLVVSATGFIYLQHGTKKSNEVATTIKKQLPHDIAPGHDNAILTLADGSTIVLDNAANGILAKQGNIKVLKLNGQIAYTGKEAGDRIVYNTITTAKGNQYQLILADGSSVWLNAASSIRFPAAFAGNERRVEITGEAYFEVAHNAAKPFKVLYTTNAGDKGEVQVLGTHFNINAYDNEASVKTTLVEGKVKVTQAASIVQLLPSQEAVFSKNNNQLKVQAADVEEAIAWKTGMFEFHDADLHSIMRQLSRWYDVEIKFTGTVSNKLYNGSIRRQATLSQVLQILKLAGVNYTLDERTLIVGTN
jgi:ferric-dicitrate binding protein FerR (iron transport regulator)